MKFTAFDFYIRWRFARNVHLTVAVPGVRLAGSAAALHTDRCHSLPSLDSAPGGGRVAPYLLRYAQSV